MGLQLEKANSELANLHAELKHFMEQRDENLISIEKKEAEILQLRTEVVTILSFGIMGSLTLTTPDNLVSYLDLTSCTLHTHAGFFFIV